MCLLDTYKPFKWTRSAYLHPIYTSQAIDTTKELLACLWNCGSDIGELNCEEFIRDVVRWLEMNTLIRPLHRSCSEFILDMWVCPPEAWDDTAQKMIFTNQFAWVTKSGRLRVEQAVFQVYTLRLMKDIINSHMLLFECGSPWLLRIEQAHMGTHSGSPLHCPVDTYYAFY